MENEFYPPSSKPFRKAASRIVEDHHDETLSQQEKEENAAKYIRNGIVGHIKRWDMTKILAVIRGEVGLETILGEYTDGVNVYKILQGIEGKPQMPLQDKVTLFLDGVAKETTHDFAALIMENGVPFSEKSQIKALIDPKNPVFQKELAELGQKLADSPDSVLREKSVASKKKSDDDVLGFSILR